MYIKTIIAMLKDRIIVHEREVADTAGMTHSQGYHMKAIGHMEEAEIILAKIKEITGGNDR